MCPHAESLKLGPSQAFKGCRSPPLTHKLTKSIHCFNSVINQKRRMIATGALD